MKLSRERCVWDAVPVCSSLQTGLTWLWCPAWSTRWELMKKRPCLRSQGLGRSYSALGWSRDLITSKPTAMEIACFVLGSSAPSRVLAALQFLNKRIYFELDLTLAFDLKKTRKAIIAIGQKQAPVAQPILLAKLEESIAQSIRASASPPGVLRLGVLVGCACRGVHPVRGRANWTQWLWFAPWALRRTDFEDFCCIQREPHDIGISI